MARAAAAATRRPPARPTAPVRPVAPRRRSTAPRPPAREGSAERPAARRAPAAAAGIRRRALATRLSGVPHSPFVERLLTGRAWIVLVAGLLAGIVFANVALLEMNAGIARTTEKVAALKRENARLRLQAARLGSTERIQKAAADIGLVLPAPGQVRYLETRPSDPQLALKRMTAPDEVPVVAAPPVAPVEPAPVSVTAPDPTAAPVPATTEATDPAHAPTHPAANEPVTPAPTAAAPAPTTTGTTG